MNASHEAGGGLTAALTKATTQKQLAAMLKETRDLNERGKRKATSDGPCYVLLPDSTVINVRDAFSFLALIITFVVVPFEVSFMDAPATPNPSDALWIFNRVIDGTLPAAP